MVQSGVLKIKNLFKVFILFSLVVFLGACESQTDQKKDSTKNNKASKEKYKITRPQFSSDSAYLFIQKQVDFGPRVPNTAAHAETAKYLSEKLGSYGFNIIEQKAKVTAFDDTKLSITNIIGEYKSELNNRVLLFAHWDTRPFADQDNERKAMPIDGANDGGSGVGVLLEVARQINLQKPNIGVDIIFFDAEDYGQPSSDTRRPVQDSWGLGSQYWGKNPHKANYNANYGILLDMVGAKNAIFAKERISLQYAPQVVEKVWSVASKLGHGNHFVYQKTNHIGVDDHVYVNKLAKIPSIDIVQYDPNTGSFAPHWHTHDDNMDIIDKETLQAVGETVLATVLKEGNSQ